jgi:hypothetical protein
MHRVNVHVVNTADPARRANTQDVLRDEVADYPVEAKMTAMTNAGTFVMLIAIGVCWICGEDPLGEWGATVSRPLGQLKKHFWQHRSDGSHTTA